MRVHQYLSGRGAPALRARPRQAGFSLVELMVALAIGLIVSLAVMIGYLGAAQSQRGQTDLVRLQESARFAFDLFGRETRNAGYANNTINTCPSGSPTSCMEGFSTTINSNSMLAGNNDATTPTLPDGSTPTVINNGDTITFRYYGAQTMDGTAPTAPSSIAPARRSAPSRWPRTRCISRATPTIPRPILPASPRCFALHGS